MSAIQIHEVMATLKRRKKKKKIKVIPVQDVEAFRFARG
jgi:hypothetical protein